jgi:hypothetical protein
MNASFGTEVQVRIDVRFEPLFAAVDLGILHLEL